METPREGGDLHAFAAALEALGRAARASVGARDVRVFRLTQRVARAGGWIGRALLVLVPSAFGFWSGALLVAMYLALEAQLNHTVMHGAFVGVEGARDLQPDKYEAWALPMQSATWRVAHKIHHAHPSVLGKDPDTIHPLFRVHAAQPWRPWHVFNTFLGTLFVFECWGLDYDAFLKARGLRGARDRGEWRKLALHYLYQYGLFALGFAAGGSWTRVLLGVFAASLLRNFIYVALQTGSSVGEGISVWHSDAHGKKSRGEWHRFQVETSKNYPVSAFWTLVTGGLDRHIEHHLWSDLPPSRLRALSPEVRALCARHGVRYTEYPSAWHSFWESFVYLWRLSRP